MKGWIAAALLVTFLSGVSSGILLERSDTLTGFLGGEADPVTDSGGRLVEKYVGEARKAGVHKQEDLDRIRGYVEEWLSRCKAEGSKVPLPESVQGRIQEYSREAEAKIRKIIDSYQKPGN